MLWRYLIELKKALIGWFFWGISGEKSIAKNGKAC